MGEATKTKMTHEVQTTEGVLLQQFENETSAQRRCDLANAEAETLGIKTRYEVTGARKLEN